MNVRVSLPGGLTRDYPAGTPVRQAIESPDSTDPGFPLVAALLNNEVVWLDHPLSFNCAVAPVDLGSKAGTVIYRKSLCFLLGMAAGRTFPKRRLIIGHSLGQGYYYHFDGLPKVGRDDLVRLEASMREIVARDLPIRSLYLSYHEAMEYFEKHNQPEAVLLLQNHNDPQVEVQSCDGLLELSHGPLAPSTGLLSAFGLQEYEPGFLLRYPPSENPLHLGPFVENPVLFSIYREYKNWGKVLQVGSVGRLDELIRDGRIQEFVQIAEALHDKKIAEIADRINEAREQVKVVLIAGPSSSGKTTFSKKLMIQLRVVGRNPVTLSLDDYFKPSSATPRDEEGRPDFEALSALDVELLNDHLVRLLSGQEVETPLFDFHTGSRKPRGQAMKLPDRAVLILEGIHGLNDALTPLVGRGQKYKVYVSALTQLNLDDHNRISTTDNRLIRRMVRDNQFRGHSALKTLSMWPSVRRGEDRNIFPFQNTADSAFNSALDYELAVLKTYAEPLLATVKPDSPEYQDARTLLRFLANFAPLHPRWVPTTSILREFIGESAFRY
ncbi:MAG TPA: nucleoside kinase [Spirochaetia bacterium]|nr:nucleoside kinase [Spirochaetia bacterium]